MVKLEFGNDASILWEGHSCSGKNLEGSSVGVIFYGDKGSVYISGGNDYKIFDKRNNVINEVKSDIVIDPQNRVNPSDQLDIIHIVNFLDAIRKGETLAAPAEGGHIATLVMQLGNISLRTGRTLAINPTDGHIVNDSQAQQFWSRTYEPGWEAKV
jgi:predicted dehydrogenase